MENILIASAVPDLTGKTIQDLGTNEIALLLYDINEAVAPVAKGTELTYDDLKAAKSFQFVKRLNSTDFEASLIIPNLTVRNMNYQAYVSGIAEVVKLGNNASSPTSLLVPDTGEGVIRITDLTDTYLRNDFPAIITAVKKSTETTLQYLTKVVALINADVKASSLVTAVLETASSLYQIKLTSKSSDINVGIATDGIFVDYQPIVVTARRLAKGTGTQIQAIERELTVFKGNGNYTEWNNEYYKESLKSSLATNYHTLSVSWTGLAQPTVSSTMAVANVNVLVCVPSTTSSLQTLFEAMHNPPAPRA
jgi:hypothetical protein